jgi:nicotinamide-nucleotide amidase
MKNCLIIVGRDLIYNKPFKEYIEDEAKSALLSIDSTIYLNDHKEFLEELRYSVNHFNNILVATEMCNFTTLAKFIASEKDDDLVLNDSILIPSTSVYCDESSFVVEFEKTNINLISVEQCKNLPTISLKNLTKEQSFHLFELDYESIEVLLRPLADIHSINFFITEWTRGWHTVKVSGERFGNVDEFIDSAKSLLKSQMIIANDIIEYIIQKLDPLDKKIAFAESCTGGMLANMFTSVSGSSYIFDGSVVTYSNEIKNRWLNVSEDNLFHYGAVSGQVVSDMCDGIMDVSDSDYAIAISGVAGPTGGSEDKPVGTVIIGVINKNREKMVEECHFNGNRAYVQKQSCYYAIKMLLKIACEDIFD